MVTLDKILNGIIIGCIVTVGSIGAYYKIKNDKEEPKPTSTSFGTFASGNPYYITYRDGGNKHGKEDKKANKAPI
jgi:hypothetical protein